MQFHICISLLSPMLNMAFQQLKIQWFSAESGFELIARVFLWSSVFSPCIDLWIFQSVRASSVNISDISMLNQGYTTLVVFSILLVSFKLSVVFPTCLESFEKQGTNVF